MDGAHGGRNGSALTMVHASKARIHRENHEVPDGRHAFFITGPCTGTGIYRDVGSVDILYYLSKKIHAPGAPPRFSVGDPGWVKAYPQDG